MRLLPSRGMPSRGSFQMRVAQEMLLRERRREISTQIYHGQLLAAGLRISQGLFDVWTSLYIDEMSHDNYRPSVTADKRKLLQALLDRRLVSKDHLARLAQYDITSTKDMRPYSLEELERIREKMRKKAVKDATHDGT